MSTPNIKKNSMIGSVSLVSGATAFSRVLGLVREQVMAYFYGAGMATDAFLTAFRIPNLLRDMFAEGALSSAFVPIFKERLVNKTEKEAFQLANVVVTAIIVFVGLIVLLGVIASPVLIYISAKGFAEIPGKFDLTVSLTRIMMVYLLLVSLSALVMGILNSFGRFGIPAISPALFNSGIILSVLIFYHYVPPDKKVYLLAAGVLIGGLGQLLIQVPALYKIGFRFKPIFNFLDEGLKKVLKLLTPMIIGLSAGRINILINTLIASFLIEGSISYLSYSYRLMHFPLGVFAVALGTVALPKVSELAAKKDFDGIHKSFDETISLNLFVVVPSAVFLALMGKELVELIYTWGRFSGEDAQNTALALLHYSYGLIGFALVRVLVPFYYAFEDSKIPMRASLISVTVNIVLYYPLVGMLNFAGLASATSLAGILNALILIYMLSAKGINISKTNLGLVFFRILVASVLAFYIAKLIPLHFYNGSAVLIVRLENLFVPLVLAVIFYFIIAVLLQVPVAKKITKKLLRK